MVQYYGDITGNLWNDFDGNGNQNYGYYGSQEPGFVGWTITLTKPSDPSFSKVTYADSSGYYSFGSLPLGDYLITVTLPSPDWVRTTNYDYGSINNSQTVILSAQSYPWYGSYGFQSYAPFGYRKPETQITGYLWNDANSNGYQDYYNNRSEQSLGGWLVYLDANNNGILDTNEKRTFTDGSGYYTFTGLDGNTNYTVGVIEPSGDWQPAIGYSNTQIIGTTTGEISQPNFAYRLSDGQIQGSLWNDANSDAIQNQSESLLAGWTVNLLQNGTLISSTVTDNGGRYVFAKVAPGDYSVEVIPLDANWQFTNSPVFPVSVSPSQLIDNVSFGLYNPSNTGSTGTYGEISGAVWNDANGDNSRNEYDPTGTYYYYYTNFGLAGWTVFLDSDNSGTLDAGETSTKTDPWGRYNFAGLASGDYNVTVIVPSTVQSWQSTGSGNYNPTPSNSRLVTVASGASKSNIDFGYKQNVSLNYGDISGYVWNDFYGDGVFDNYNYSNDKGLAGWKVTLEDVSGQTVQTTLTDKYGYYGFTGVSSFTSSPPSSLVYDVNTGYYDDPSTGNDYQLQPNVSVNLPQYLVLDLLGTGVNSYIDQDSYYNSGQIIEYSPNNFFSSVSPVPPSDYYLYYDQTSGLYQGPSGNTYQFRPSVLTYDAQTGLYYDAQHGLNYPNSAFANVNPTNGSYTVTVESPDGLNTWQSTYSPPQPIVYSGSGINFGYQSTYSGISGFIWNDVNGNGKWWYSGGQEANESNLPHWKINLIQNGQIIDSIYTTSSQSYYGWYYFGSRPFGDYTVSVELPSADWQPTQGNNSVGATSVSFTTSAQNPWGGAYNYFGFQGTKGEISGFLWDDIDKSGTWNWNFNGTSYQFEPALNGWTVYLDQNNNNVRDPGETNTVTDNLGGYEFKDLVAGTYRVKVDTPVGWQFTFPTPPEKVLTITTSEIFSNVNFGYVQGSGNRPPQIQNRLWGRSIVDNVTIPGVYVDPDGNALTGTATKADGTSLPPWLTLTVQSNGDLTLNSNNPPRYFVPFDVKIAVTDGQASIDHIFRIYPSYSGFVIDNYVAGATVFFDADKDGVLDTNEPFTTTDQTGFYLLDIPQSFDTNANGVFDPEEGRLVVFGGVDTATGLPLQTPLTALAGSTTITALTSLVENLVSQGLTVEQANTAVTTALSLPAGVDLSNIDPIVATTNNTPGGAATFAALVQVQNAITQIAGLLDGASSASTGDIVKNVVSALASQIQGGTTIDLTNATKLQTVIQEAATLTNNVDVSAIAAGAAQVIAAANQKIEDIAASTPNASLQQEFAQVQKVALGETTNDLQQAGAGTKSITDVVTENTGTALTDQINNAQVLSQAPTDVSLNTSSVAENLPVGTEVGTFSTVDPDSSEPFTYSLIGGTGSTDNSLFQISGNRLLTNAIFDYESKNSYSIRVQTSDSNGGVFQKALTINVNDVNENENPTDLSLSNNSVAENSPLNTLIGNFTTTDPDTGNTFTYSLVTGTGDTDNSLFTIDGNQLKTNTTLDYESKNSYSIRVKTTDQGGLSYEKQLTVSVSDVNENPTNLTLSNNTVAENSPLNTLIGNFTTTDPDTGNTFTYSLVTGTGDTDNSLFTIDGNQLKVNGLLDYETKNNYSIRVKTTDQGGLSYEKQLNVSVSDVNENPTNLNLSNNTVAENSPLNTLIGNFNTTDPDTGNTFSYSLVTGIGSTDNSLFTIDGNQLKTNTPLNYETKNNYSIRVKTTDQGGLSYEKQLTVNVTNIPEQRISIDKNAITFGTPLSQYRQGWSNSNLVRPKFADTFRYIDITNTGVNDEDILAISNIEVKASNVTTNADFSQGDILLNPGQTWRVQLTYAPTAARESFNLNDGLVIHSNAINNTAYNIALTGKSTFNSDITYNGKVDRGDLAPLQAAFNSSIGSPKYDPTADINGDGGINLGDFLVLTSDYGLSLI
ncbi:MAG: hypothetical protein EWV85_08025 [Microcystis aeruginosa Ma_QC_C_20070703_M131]|uniref:Cadherin domain-containing protein n=1 Tax=Microcystis aeruginosa Ma_QC_C_20070703_M131 TaxID=2486263 RepID=A0A551Y6J5_MICAE|nr:MAG: hypothetical protein EWV85_08025 [Microcystis aeruginosa Ma_QC_C_20070703_M131]